ncbi:hypothetical protein [Streptosporangium canum]|nr:hypothetical protein [Streptosporangium canum]
MSVMGLTPISSAICWTAQVSHDLDLYRQRNTVERRINKIKEWRGPAFRFGKPPESYLAGPHLRGAILRIRSLRPI